MMRHVLENSTNAEKDQVKGDEWRRFVDIHCHCLPNIDDGPDTMTESLALCEMLATDGITELVATPHQLGRFDGCNEAADVRQGVYDLNESLKKKGIKLEVLPGGEVRVDERICLLLKADKILTLADGGRFVLIELPYEVCIDIEPLITELASMEIQAIISHAEKLTPSVAPPHTVLKWLGHATHIQITAGSLLGDFGLRVQQRAWRFLASGWATLVATDAHDTKVRRPRMKQAFEQIQDELGDDIANLVCVENPLRVINGQDFLYPWSRYR